jgi:adenosine deaminase
MMRAVVDLVAAMPKAELHCHLEGTLEPELIFALAQRNGIALRYQSVESLKSAYRFRDLQDFLDLYYQGTSVLRVAQDFYDLTYAYLVKAAAQHVVHAELFFDPQAHTSRGVDFATIIDGIGRALADGEARLGITSRLIMCFLRDRPEAEAEAILDAALPFRAAIAGIGLDSAERGNPPSKFRAVFARARALGLRCVAHAGEEGPAAYVGEALDLLRVDRIDHGNRCLEDDALVERLRALRIGLTLCPLSNLRLGVVKTMADHPLPILLKRGLLVTVNSDDPAYFGGYINENYLAVAEATGLTGEDIQQLAENAFTASFLDAADKARWIARLDEVARGGLADGISAIAP